MKKASPPVPQLQSGEVLVDTHCHLDMDAYRTDLKTVLTNCSKYGIRYIVTIGIDLSSSQRAIEIAKQTPMVFATIGVHPHDVDNITAKTYTNLKELALLESQHIVGYGEIGLDYAKQYSSIQQQRIHFKKQLVLAKDLKLPVVIHNREADNDMLSILKEASPFDKGGIMHCFSSDYDYAQKIMDLGLHISVPGIVTYKNASALKEVVRKVPLTSLLLETDGPFLSPHPHRGKRNEPLNLLFTATEVATLRGISLEEVARQTTKNAIDVFDLPQIPPPHTS